MHLNGHETALKLCSATWSVNFEDAQYRKTIKGTKGAVKKSQAFFMSFLIYR